MKWTEANIGRALTTQYFNMRHLVIVPNCSWTGHEADLLVVTKNLRLMDVEIKISRSDFKADAKKEKWWHRRFNQRWLDGPPCPDLLRDHPPSVWKHYYAMPSEIWHDDLMESIASQSSGVLLLTKSDNGFIRANVKRHAKPNRKADKITAEQAIDIARLASIRMWEAYVKLESA